MYIYIYMYLYIHVYVYMYTHVHTRPYILIQNSCFIRAKANICHQRLFCNQIHEILRVSASATVGTLGLDAMGSTGFHWVPDQRYHPAPWPGRGHRSCWSPAVGLSAFCHMALWGERSISNYGIWSIYGHVMILQLFWFVKCCGPQVDMERHISGIYNS